MLLAWFSAATFIIVAMVVYLFFYTGWRRRRAAAQPFPKKWQRLLTANMALYDRLPDGLREKLHQLILIFLDEKRFYGCDGLTVSDPMRVLIAAQACLLVLNRGIHHYDKLNSILVYPSMYRAQEQIYDLGGVHSHHASQRLGESWQAGRVILSWVDVLDDAQQSDADGNVSLHEFSHQLDQLNGDADGLPVLTQQQSIQEWSQVFQQEFEQLRQRASTSNHLHQAAEDVIDDYGAESPAEFFAVVTEAFFVKPAEMASRHPALYEQLQKFYQLDPAAW